MIEELYMLEEFYTKHSIYKSLFLCSSEVQEELHKKLLEYDHSVINVKDIVDIVDFEESPKRVILVNIDLWKNNKHTINKYILPFQNLIVLYDLTEYQHILIKHWIRIVNKYEYITDPDAKILNLDDY